MLQQTQVDRVLPKYAEWLEKYPSLHALAAAPEQEVTKTWYPLGYNIRPKRLQSIARESVARYGGQLPSDEETLRSFKGIGAYTAGAIRSFAFRERAAILDTNVARVLFRVFVGKGDPKSHAMKRHLWSVSETLVPDSPRVRLQPGADGPRRHGLRGAKSEVPGLPDGERVRVATIVVTAAVIERDGRVLVTRRQQGVHLEGYWEFPGGKCDPGESLAGCLARELREELDVDARVGPEMFTTTHAYDDRHVELHFFACELLGEPRPLLGQEMRWVRARRARRPSVPAGRRRVDCALTRQA